MSNSLPHPSCLLTLVSLSRHKDRRSKQSVLTTAESIRFRTAIYNLWILIDGTTEIHHEWDDDEEWVLGNVAIR